MMTSIDLAFVVHSVEAKNSFDPLRIVNELNKIGCNAVLVCEKYNGTEDTSYLVLAATDVQKTKDFWYALNAQIAIPLLYQVDQTICEKIAACGISIYMWIDGDGEGDYRYPIQWLINSALSRKKKSSEKLRDLTYFLKQRLAYFDNAIELTKLRLSQKLLIESQGAKNVLQSYLGRKNLSRQAEHVFVVPHIPKREFTEPPLITAKQNVVAGACRWADETKNTRGWVKATERVPVAHQRWHVCAFGAANHPEFDSSKANIQRTAWIDLKSLAERIGSSKILLVTSFRESLPIVALEAFCMGCTVVVPPLPCANDLVQNGEFGTIAKSWSTAAFRQAIASEIKMWDSGAREPSRVASFWRNKCSINSIAQKYMSICCELQFNSKTDPSL